MKDRIEKLIEQGESEAAEEYLNQYMASNIYDSDILLYEADIALLNGDLEVAYEYLGRYVRRLPQSAVGYRKRAFIEELRGNISMAIFLYYKAAFLYKYNNCEAENETILEKNNKLLSKINNKKEEHLSNLKSIKEMTRNAFGMFEIAYRSREKIIGTRIRLSMDEDRYIGLYDNGYLRSTCYHNPEKYPGDMDMDLMHHKGEFICVKEGEEFTVEDAAVVECDEYLLPVACDNMYTDHVFECNEKKNVITQLFDKTFEYYRVKYNSHIHSSGKCYYGNPVPLNHSSDRKRLVLHIFVDGLSGEVLQGDNMEKYMPYTYSYFSKGVICDNAYACAEWTYPSIANIVSGLYTPNHMMFHNEIDVPFPEEITTLDEMFHNDGYYTTRLSGDWRIAPQYGYCRGIDRFIYQNSVTGYEAEAVISDAVNSLEAFSETDQYLWISISDLHNIADSFGLPIEVQTHMPLEYRNCNANNSTSVKQAYDVNKTEQYLMCMKRLDIRLNMLYQYLEENYNDSDIIVSLFSDHGQGYLVPEGEHFMSKERSKIALMLRGGKANLGIRTDELISSIDYPDIMCELAGIKNTDPEWEGNLPEVFGGKKRREYAISESLHPGDPYQAVIHTDDMCFEFVNTEPVQNDGRFRLGQYSCVLKDCNGYKMDNEMVEKKYLDILLNHVAHLFIYE